MGRMKVMELPLNKDCSIAHSLEVLGQKWNLLIMREAFRGSTRYADFLKIGVTTDVLAGRLSSLVENGLLERRPYRGPGERAREEYVMTEAGRDLLPILAAFAEWGDQYRAGEKGPAALFVDGETGEQVTLAFADKDGNLADPARVRLVGGPGAPDLG